MIDIEIDNVNYVTAPKYIIEMIVSLFHIKYNVPEHMFANVNYHGGEI